MADSHADSGSPTVLLLILGAVATLFAAAGAWITRKRRRGPDTPTMEPEPSEPLDPISAELYEMIDATSPAPSPSGASEERVLEHQR